MVNKFPEVSKRSDLFIYLFIYLATDLRSKDDQYFEYLTQWLIFKSENIFS